MIELTELCKTYKKPNTPEVVALDKVTLTIDAGEFVAILGPSGSGKSTLINMMGLLDKPDSGSYRLKQQDVYRIGENQLAKVRNKTIGFVFQSFHLMPRTTALENIQLPLLYADRADTDSGGIVHGGMVTKSRAALEAVGLADRGHHYTHELSGGQQQRVAIARAIVNEPDLILADEPTGNLDSKSEQGIIDLFKELNSRGKTIVFITHSMEVANNADRVINILDGRINKDTNKVSTPKSITMS